MKAKFGGRMRHLLGIMPVIALCPYYWRLRSLKPWMELIFRYWPDRFHNDQQEMAGRRGVRGQAPLGSLSVSRTSRPVLW